MGFDYSYWGIYQENLETGEERIQELANQYQLSMDDLCNIEENAKEHVQELLQCSPDIDELTDTINKCKIEAAINLICSKHNLETEDFDYEINGEIIEIIYKNERIA